MVVNGLIEAPRPRPARRACGRGDDSLDGGLSVVVAHEAIEGSLQRRARREVAALQRALDGLMRYYNTERPHQGYRLRGRTPAALVWGVAPQ